MYNPSHKIKTYPISPLKTQVELRFSNGSSVKLPPDTSGVSYEMWGAPFNELYILIRKRQNYFLCGLDKIDAGLENELEKKLDELKTKSQV